MDAIVSLIQLAVFVLVIAGMWKTFVKAGQPGWGCLVPFYNIILLARMGGKPGWWGLLMLIPLLGLIPYCIVVHNVSRNFGQGIGFTLGLIFLPFIFYPILGFGDATYGGADAARVAA